MILIGQYDSPFVRRTAIALRLYGLPFEHRPWSTFGDADRLAVFNPLRRVPTLVLNARNDPFIPADSLAHPDEVSAAVTLEMPHDGGHAGFVVGRPPGRLDWLPQRLLRFFADGV